MSEDQKRHLEQSGGVISVEQNVQYTRLYALHIESDQHACIGFFEYGLETNDSGRIQKAKQIFDGCVAAALPKQV